MQCASCGNEKLGSQTGITIDGKRGEKIKETWISKSKPWTQFSSIVVVVVAWYWALVEERATIHYFLELDDMGLAPKSTT